MGGRGVAGVALNALHVKCFYQGFDAQIPRQATRLAEQTTTTMSWITSGRDEMVGEVERELELKLCLQRGSSLRPRPSPGLRLELATEAAADVVAAVGDSLVRHWNWWCAAADCDVCCAACFACHFASFYCFHFFLSFSRSSSARSLLLLGSSILARHAKTSLFVIVGSAPPLPTPPRSLSWMEQGARAWACLHSTASWLHLIPQSEIRKNFN